MWEDKGPSFTKMTKDQYLKAGNDELGNNAFYEEVNEDPSIEIKRKCDILVQKMVKDNEISEKVGEYTFKVEVINCQNSTICSKHTIFLSMYWF